MEYYAFKHYFYNSVAVQQINNPIHIKLLVFHITNDEKSKIWLTKNKIHLLKT